MNKRIAMHHYPGDFSERWIKYCEHHGLRYQLVDCYKNEIIEEMKEFDILLWSWNLSHFESLQFAKELIYSLEKMGKLVFPNFKTSFFYDNKVGQKYLLEAIDAPRTLSYVFYDKDLANKWVKETKFPKVFKLSGGAGSMNVQLCSSKRMAFRLINKAFGKGFSQVNRWHWFIDKMSAFIENPSVQTMKIFIRSAGRLFVPTQKERLMGREKGYVYFQDFLPKNSFDIRVIVIGKGAFAFKRLCRKNDFRASGSGKIIYDKNQINTECIKIAFETSKKLEVQCMAYDFVFDSENKPLIVEMSYHFSTYVYDKCEGCWDENLNWKEEKVNPQNMIIESLLVEGKTYMFQRITR